MKLLFLGISLFVCISASAQVLDLKEIESSIRNITSGEYKTNLTDKGFKLSENKEDGRSGFYEKWVRNDNALYITIQHNDNFKFTKMLITSSTPESSITIKHILEEVGRNYSKKTTDDQVYYLNEEKPQMTIHEVYLENNEKKIEGVMFFRKYN